MKITKTQLKKIIIEELEKEGAWIEAPDGEPVTEEDIEAEAMQHAEHYGISDDKVKVFTNGGHVYIQVNFEPKPEVFLDLDDMVNYFQHRLEPKY